MVRTRFGVYLQQGWPTCGHRGRHLRPSEPEWFQ